MASKVNWDDIIAEWSYRLPKGFPTMKNGKFTVKSELKVLQEVLTENGIKEMPDFTKKTPAPLQEEESRVSKESLIDLINKMPLDAMSDSGIQKLYNRVKAFTTYKPITSALKDKGYAVDPKKGFDIPKQVSNVLQGFLEDLPPNSYQSFVDHIQGRDPMNPEKTRPAVNFPTTPGWSTLDKHLPSYLDQSVLDAIARYTGQDEKKRGVGMGEVLMALVFDNIKKPQGKGDLELEKGEFEVKGDPGILGAISDKAPQGTADILAPTGITITQSNKLAYTNEEGNVESFDLGKLAEALARAARDGKGDAVKQAVESLLLASKGAGTVLSPGDVSTAVGLLPEWNNASAADINRVFGLSNFIRYATKEGFTRFIAIDYGSGGKGSGKYVYVQGSPTQMATDLMKFQVPFKGVALNSLWPRIMASGGPSDTVVQEDIENDDWDY